MEKDLKYYKAILQKTLEQFFEARESENIIKIYFEDRFLPAQNTSFFESEQFIKIFWQDLQRFNLREPVQYITGKAWFFNSLFSVDNSVLIPRPETEELVKKVLDFKPQYNNPKIIDIGTGSGCIALSIGKEWHKAVIEGVEISENALKIAEKNKSDLNINNVTFHCFDFLDESTWQKTSIYDIIVSNPPYISIHEANEMDYSTLNFEPHTALFPKGEDHLLFYKKILDFAHNHLNPGGIILCEINEFHSSGISGLLIEKNLFFKLYKDIQGKDRILEIQGFKPGKNNYFVK